jgi:GGDEF domain-containing protein
VWQVFSDPQPFTEWQLYVWTAAVTVAEFLPVPTNVSMAFSLSFPLELSAAMLFPTPAAAAIAFVGSSEPREFRGEVPPLKSLFARSQIALCVIAESLIFTHLVGPNHSAEFTHVLAGIPAWKLILPTFLGRDRRLFAEHLLRGLVRPLPVGQEPVVDHRRDASRRLRRIPGVVHGARAVRRLGRHIRAIARHLRDPRLRGAARLRASDVPANALVARATTELAEKQAENEYQALHDSLTGMPNRMLFQQRLVEAIAEGRRTGETLAVMLIDLDHFKEINDTLGHHFGDLLLQEIGPRLSSVLRENDLMARLGWGRVRDRAAGAPVGRRRAADRRPAARGARDPRERRGAGPRRIRIRRDRLFPSQANDAEALLRRADVAMYSAKENGGGYELYADDMDRHNPARLTLIGQVRPALEGGEFSMYYQPKVRLSDGRAAGAEGLIRWEHPSLGLLSPDEFIPLVEKTVLLRPLTHYVIAAVLEQWREWADMGIRIPIAVNVSPRSLLDQDLPEEVRDELRRWEVPPAFLRWS